MKDAFFQLGDKVWIWRYQQQAAGRFLCPPFLPFPLLLAAWKCFGLAFFRENPASFHPIQWCLKPVSIVVYPQCCHKSERAIMSVLPRWIFNKQTLSSWISCRIFAFILFVMSAFQASVTKNEVFSRREKSPPEAEFFAVDSHLHTNTHWVWSLPPPPWHQSTEDSVTHKPSD